MKELEILEKLVSFNTINDKENESIVDYICNYLKDLDIDFKKIKDENGNYNVIASIGKSPILGFSGHIDTVDINNNWTYDPFKLTKAGNKLVGLGACDMKGGIAAILTVLKDINLNKLKRGIKLYFTTDEETYFKGIKCIANSKEIFPKYLIFCEPTDLVPIIATKGALSFEIRFKGVSTHSSTPDKGKNAILEAIKFSNDVISFYKKIEKEKSDTFNVNQTTMNIGKINGGTMVNIVPDECSLSLEFRTINKSHNDRIKKTIINLLKNYNCDYKITVESNPMICKDKEFVALIESKTAKGKGMSFLTEASFVNNTNSIILGPGPITAHEADEYIYLDSYIKTIELYKNIINDICK
jgi:acetylornithine deacetylase